MNRVKHGLACRGKLHPLWHTWQALKQRCYNPKNKDYYLYGARGISVCSRWRNSFPSFLQDVGNKPIGKSLDRKNNEGNYDPDNVRWATHKQQRRNQRPWGSIRRSKATHYHQKGEENPRAKLTAKEVCFIRQAYASGTIRQVDLARQFQVTRELIHAVVRRKVWQHI